MSPITLVIGDTDTARENHLDDLLRRHAAAGGQALLVTTPCSSLADLMFWPGLHLATSAAALSEIQDVDLVVIDELSEVWATTRDVRRLALRDVLGDLTCAAISGRLRLVLGLRRYPASDLLQSRHVQVEHAMAPVSSLTRRWAS